MEHNSSPGSEDSSSAREHAENAAENRDALAASAHRNGGANVIPRESVDADGVAASSAPPPRRDAQNAQAAREVGQSREALEAQAHRTEASVSGSDAGSSARDAGNAEAAREVRENRAALEEQARRTAATTPPDVDMTGPARPHRT